MPLRGHLGGIVFVLKVVVKITVSHGSRDSLSKHGSAGHRRISPEQDRPIGDGLRTGVRG